MVEDSELEVTEDVFEYVDEAQYAKIVQERQEEGFVLDDGQYSNVYNVALSCVLMFYRWFIL